MTIEETRDILNKLSPDGLQDWMTDRHQMFVQVAMLEVPVPIDKQELEGLSNDKVKELIHNRMISALKDKLSILQEKINATR